MIYVLSALVVKPVKKLGESESGKKSSKRFGSLLRFEINWGVTLLIVIACKPFFKRFSPLMVHPSCADDRMK